MRNVDQAMRNIDDTAAAGVIRLRAFCVAALLALAGGCSTTPPPVEEPVAPVAEQLAPEPPSGRFAIAASMLDTWNAVGQLLVAFDGVHYEGRAQMLGIYALTYRGEKFLIVTRARVIETPGVGMLTDVSAVGHDGQLLVSPAAVEVLGLLQQKLPAELARIAALPPEKKPGASKPPAKKKKKR